MEVRMQPASARTRSKNGGKWRFLSKSPLPVEDQTDAFSSENPEKHERDRNNRANCKTLNAARPQTDDHASCGSGRVTVAAEWYAANRDTCPPPIIPTLRSTFGFTACEAIEVIRRAAYGARP
jgi:hypothetical protein